MTVVALNVQEIAGLSGVVIALVIAAGAALALLRNSYLKTQVEQLRGDREDLTARVELTRDEFDAYRLRKDAEVTALTAKLDGQQQQITALQALVTGKAELTALAELLNEGRRELAMHEEQCLERHRVTVLLLRGMNRQTETHFYEVYGLLGDRRDVPLNLPGDDDDPPHDDLRPYIPPSVRRPPHAP